MKIEPRQVEAFLKKPDLRIRGVVIYGNDDGLVAERALCVRDATRFKRDALQIAAPDRQAAVFARVRALAADRAADFPSLPDVVEAAYRVLVAGFIAGEERFFSETEPIPT